MVKHIRFRARISTVYSKLPPVNDLFSKILNQTDICHRFSCRISSEIFQLCCIRIQFAKFFNFSPNFLHSFMLILPFQEQLYFRLYFQSCKLVIFNSQIDVSPLGPILEIYWYDLIFYHLFIYNQGQASALKVAYIFKIFRAQNGLMVTQQFYEVTQVCEEYNNFQDSKSKFMISDFPNNAFEAAEFLVHCWPNSCFMFVTKEKLFFNLWFLLLLSERMLSPESYLAICHSRANCL